MKRTGEPHIWEEEITDFHSLLIDTRRFEIRLVEDHEFSSEIRTEVLKIWHFEEEPTIGNLGKILSEVPEILGIEVEL